jgi:hypothetical protein
MTIDHFPKKSEVKSVFRKTTLSQKGYNLIMNLNWEILFTGFQKAEILKIDVKLVISVSFELF